MKPTHHCKTSWLATLALSCGLLGPVHGAELITNGGFEAGLAGWTQIDQVGSDGSFLQQTGTTSPVVDNSNPVPPPPEGSYTAMTDAQGPGSHILYQNFVVAVASAYTLNFSLFIGNQAEAFHTPDTLDFSTEALNQQARVDIMTISSDPFSLLAGDVLANVFATVLGDPLTSGYQNITVDLTTLLSGRHNETLRLRFAQVDNVNIFNFGVDQVSLTAGSTHVPEALSWWPQCLSIVGILVVGSLHRRRSNLASRPV